MTDQSPTWTVGRRLKAGLALKCPRCGQGAVFASMWKMHPQCPVCGLAFERGPGYFTGAMYFSYALELPIIAVGTLIAWRLWPHWSIAKLVGITWIASLPLVPWVFQRSRALFMHFDRAIDPGE